MHKIIYILSNEIDYSKVICRDVGPKYAKSMDWDMLFVSDLLYAINIENCIYVIDNRISENEMFVLKGFIIKNKTLQFVLKLVDPYIENFVHPYYVWVSKMMKYMNVRLFSVYETKELILDYAKRISKPIIYIPYPYDMKNELPLKNLEKRKNRVIISGSINRFIYPFRYSVWKTSRRSLSRVLYDVLRHPGYSELSGEDFSHQIIGASYIEYLAKYKFMLLCPSRCKIEFLKYYECAYSGCLPLGDYPTCFPKEIRKLFRLVNTCSLFTTTASYILFWKKPVHLQIVEEYRNYFRSTRNKKLLNELFINQL